MLWCCGALDVNRLRRHLDESLQAAKRILANRGLEADLDFATRAAMVSVDTIVQ
jgi:hypothetical protein